jgi:transcriptional regulator with XRE-family HTH domain
MALNARIGERIRTARIARGMPQQQLADQIGVSYQQIHKYEWGENIIAASMLYAIARALDLPVEYFYGTIPPPGAPESVPPPPDEAIGEWIRAVNDIQDPRLRSIVLKTARLIAAG